jgi:histidine kinase/DNA gyrase B/HSP90-like ATPase
MCLFHSRTHKQFFTTKPTGEGSGLGLSISHDIVVKQHGGLIDVDAKHGGFTEFRIIFGSLGRYTSDILDLVEEGNKVCGKLRYHVYHECELLGFPPTGRHV